MITFYPFEEINKAVEDMEKGLRGQAGPEVRITGSGWKQEEPRPEMHFSRPASGAGSIPGGRQHPAFVLATNYAISCRLRGWAEPGPLAGKGGAMKTDYQMFIGRPMGGRNVRGDLSMT